MLAWKNTPNKKALIVKGLRQVGKTTSVRAFAQDNYENVVYVNFKSNYSANLTVNNSVDKTQLDYNEIAKYRNT